jgi:ABC-type phosphate transport system ATPase subunit
MDEPPTSRADWTVDHQSGRANSSEAYIELVEAVADLLDNSASQLMSGQPGRRSVARLIVSHLAHKHGMVPDA